jgi:beta-glucanase (GH16 family)
MQNKTLLSEKKRCGFFGLMTMVAIVCTLGNQNINAQIYVDAVDYATMKGVQTENTLDLGGGKNVGWIDATDWMEYSIVIPVTGEYRVDFRVASQNNTGNIQFRQNGNLLISLAVTATGGWQTWQTKSTSPIALDAGTYTFRLTAATGGFNLNWWQLVLITPADADVPTKPIITSSSTTEHNINIAWDASTDATSAIGCYKLMLEGILFATTSEPSIAMVKLPPGKTFNFQIIAFDIAGNASEPTDVSLATTEIPWALLWSDEFDTDGPVDPTKWNFQTGGGGWGNNESQYYTNGSNASKQDGNLIIEVKKQQVGTNPYTSTRMNTSGKGDFLYGRIDVRAKLPRTGGTWPAIWMLPTDWAYGDWPKSGEIDIMEHTGNNYGHILGTVHTGAYNHTLGTQKGAGTDLTNVTEEFHNYTIEWYPDHIDWYVDDVLYYTFENEYKTPAEWPFDKRHHILLNVAVGGNMGGTIDANGVWPQQMVVEYVRVYDFNLLENDAEAPEKITNLGVVPKWTTATASWYTAKDNVGIDFYRVYINDELRGTSNGVTYLIQNLEPLTTYTLGIQAVDYAGNESEIELKEFTTTDIINYTVPGRIQAEGYINMFGIDTQTTTDTGGGTNVGWIDANDWMTYNINVTESAAYSISYRYASTSASRNIQLKDDANNTIISTTVPATGDWQAWQTAVSTPFNLTQGIHTIKLTTSTGGFNLNWIEFKKTGPTVGIEEVTSKSDLDVYPIPLIDGNVTIELPNYSGVLDVNIFSGDGKLVYKETVPSFTGKANISKLNLNAGTYILSVITKDNSYSKLLMVK